MQRAGHLTHAAADTRLELVGYDLRGVGEAALERTRANRLVETEHLGRRDHGSVQVARSGSDVDRARAGVVRKIGLIAGEHSLDIDGAQHVAGDARRDGPRDQPENGRVVALALGDLDQRRREIEFATRSLWDAGVSREIEPR